MNTYFSLIPTPTCTASTRPHWSRSRTAVHERDTLVGEVPHPIFQTCCGSASTPPSVQPLNDSGELASCLINLSHIPCSHTILIVEFKFSIKLGLLNTKTHASYGSCLKPLIGFWEGDIPLPSSIPKLTNEGWPICESWLLVTYNRNALYGIQLLFILPSHISRPEN